MAKLNTEKATKDELTDYVAKRFGELPKETLAEFARRLQASEITAEALASTAVSMAPIENRPDQPAQPGAAAQAPADPA